MEGRVSVKFGLGFPLVVLDSTLTSQFLVISFFIFFPRSTFSGVEVHKRKQGSNENEKVNLKKKEVANKMERMP